MTKKNRYLVTGLSIIIACVLAAIIVLMAVRQDVIKKSEIGYEELSYQLEIIKEDFNKVYSYDNYNISPSQNGCKVTLTHRSHDGITMICNFDNDFNYLDSTYITPAIIDNFLVIIFMFIILGGIFSFIVVWVGKNLYY